MNKKKLAIILCCVVCVILLVVVLKPAEEEDSAQSQGTVTIENFDFAGEGAVIAAHLDMFDAVNRSMMGEVEFAKEDLLLTVDGVPLLKEELESRKQRLEFYPQKKTEKELLDRLIQEKVEIAIAKKYDIMPTEEEVTAFIERERKDAQEYAGEEIEKKFCTNSGLTLDNYWNIYERYNAIRILTFGNVERYYYETYYPQETEVSARSSEKIQKQYQKQLKKWIRQADIVYYK